MKADEVREVFGKSFGMLVEAARTNYLAFYALMGLRPEHPKVVGDLQESLCNLVQNVESGNLVLRQTTSCPPQHGKSDCLVRLSIPWIMGRRPGCQVALAAYNYGLVEELSLAAREVCEHPWYNLVFKDNQLSMAMCRATNWGTTNGARLRAVSFGRKLTGRRVDWFIGDDVFPGRAEVESPRLREKVIQWYFADCYSRISPEAVIWLLGTRWHPEDLQGFLHSEKYRSMLLEAGKESEVFSHTNYPAIADPTEDEPDPLGRAPGEPLCPEIGRDLNFLEAVRATTPAYEWESQYQGNPRALGGGQVDTDLIELIPMDRVPRNLKLGSGWDLATSIRQTADFSANAKLGWSEEERMLYIIRVWRAHLSWPQLKKVAAAKMIADGMDPVFPCRKTGVEGVSGFSIGYHELRDAVAGKIKVVQRNPPKNVDKLTRAMPWLSLIDAGRVKMVVGPHTRDFIDELNAFPIGAHDDMVDAVSIAYEEITRTAVPLLA